MCMHHSDTEYISPVLRECTGCLVEERVCYKILMQTFKCVNGLAPSYLSNILNLYSPARALRSADSNILKQPKARTKYGERHFAFAAATLWNGLPMHIRSTETLGYFLERDICSDKGTM
jgi:hypothetical protein